MMSNKPVELKKLSKSDAGKFQQTGQSILKLANGQEVVINIKSLGVNLQERLEDEWPYPEVPTIKRFNRQTQAWEYIPNDSDAEYQRKLKEVNTMRTYQIVLWGVDLDIEGENFEEKVKTLIGSGFPVGAFSKLAEDIMKLSQVDQETFQ